MPGRDAGDCCCFCSSSPPRSAPSWSSAPSWQPTASRCSSWRSWCCSRRCSPGSPHPAGSPSSAFWSASSDCADGLGSRTPQRRSPMLVLLFVASTVCAGVVLVTILASDGFALLELAILVLFSALFAWITTSCWITVIGFLDRLLGLRRRPLLQDAAKPVTDARPSATALVMPVYNESPERVVAGVRATLESLCEQKTDGRYDLSILRDRKSTRLNSSH